MIRSTVVGLNFVCCPAHIARLIVAIVVNAVDAVFWRWTRPNVSKKIEKRFAPALANGDAATTVVLVSLAFCVAATPDYKLPNAIQLCSAVAMISTTTISPVVSAKTDTVNNNLATTAALTKPHDPVVLVRKMPGKDLESTKRGANWNRLFLTHDSLLFSGLRSGSALALPTRPDPFLF